MDTKELARDRALAKQAHEEKVKQRLFEALKRSITGIHIDPISDRGADGVVLFKDPHSVIHDHQGADERRLIRTWLSLKIQQGVDVNDNARLAWRIAQFPDGYRISILKLDQHGGFERCWFEIIAR